MVRSLFAVSLFTLAAAGAAPGQAAASFDYQVGVVSESGDIVTWIQPGPDSLVVDRVVPLGIMPNDIDGPHNLAVAPDGQSYYVTIAHGAPYGALWRLAVRGDTLVGQAPLEMFPTTIALTPDGELAFVANSDFHGDHPRQNVVSIVHTPGMMTVANLPACDMPHGVKANHAGNRVYVSCMHSDELLELDVDELRIARRESTGAAHTGSGHGAHGACAPTFVSVSPDDRTLYVACNTGNTLQVWDAATLTRTAEVTVGNGAYNVEPSPDGTLVIVTNKKGQTVSLVDPVRGAEVARIPTSKKVVHGVAFSPDGRFAYISSESVGSDPGAVDMIDLAARRVVATVAVPAQPTGIAVLPR